MVDLVTEGSIGEIQGLVDYWVQEVVDVMIVDKVVENVDDNEEELGAWDDVNGGELPPDKVKEARNEEVGVLELNLDSISAGTV